MSTFFSSQLKNLAPYTPGEQPQDQQYVKLNTNESPYPPSAGVIAALNDKEAADLRLYSDPECKELKKALAGYYGVEPENIYVGNGSDEALNFAFLSYATDGRGVAFADITYGFYPVFADLYHIPVQIVPLKSDFSIAPKDYYGLNKTIVIANPNAPTGLALSRDEMEGIIKANPDSVVVVDEAYVDFGAESCVELTKIYPNLLVVQTYSKSRSMAGARLGYAIGNAELIRDLETVKFSTNPYNVNRLTLRAGVQAIAEQDYYTENCKKIMATRAYTKEKLEALGFTVLDSRSNFLFAMKPGTDGGAIYRGLKERGVLVRHFDKDPIRDYNRITIGTPEQMDIFLKKLEELL
ncbi:histidinol-phosphate transaminase [Pseudoflavonifractor phocaeensis]|uniref:histidinol-phosphate transaminase n=1 Tax=Pseudoflavonifractor phocaeensis TaxID=1870988 RepID=UPI0025A40D27|nr:histidinol-phosphate transaminase [Pseudoflavonifractor phocaeensis]MDM8239416.1 histidinol-phosphate transaminase [Pseudoflavonifractor phocaeensis]